MTTEDKIFALLEEADPQNPIEYMHAIARPLARKKHDELLKSCQDCPTCKLADYRSITYGDSQASVLIVNDGIYESQLGENKIIYPLRGTPEMSYLDKIIEAYHINRRQLFWINAINCYTCTKINGKSIERIPNSHEAEYCRGYVENIIDIINPVMIILLGNIPLNLFQDKESICQAHGKWIDIRGIKAMPVYSPHSLLAQKMDETLLPEIVEEYETEFCEDLRKAFVYVQNNFDGNVVLEPLEP
jgi:uracil DNA glycosylase superfamily